MLLRGLIVAHFHRKGQAIYLLLAGHHCCYGDDRALARFHIYRIEVFCVEGVFRNSAFTQDLYRCAAEAFIGCVGPVRNADSRAYPKRIVYVSASAGRYDGRSVDRIRERFDLESNANEYAFSRHFKGLRKSDVVCNTQMVLILITGLQFGQIASDRHVSLLCIGGRLSCCVGLSEPYANFRNVLE